MCVVHQQVAAERARREVIDAARAVCHVAHDNRLGPRTERLDDVGDSAREQQQALGHLQCHPRRLRFADVMDRLVDFEVVVGRQEPDRCVERGVVENLGRDLGYCPATCVPRLRGYCRTGSVGGGVFGMAWQGSMYVVLNRRLLYQGSPAAGAAPWLCVSQRNVSVVALQPAEQALETSRWAGAARRVRGYPERPW